MRHPKADTDIVVGERVKSVSWQSKLLFFDQREGSEARAITSLQQRMELRLRRLGAVGSAASLALAIVLAGVFATALALAIVLAFARVLGGVGGSVLSDQEHAGVGGRTCSGGAPLLDGLCVQASSRAAEQAYKCGSNGEGMWSMVLHEGLRFLVQERRCLPTLSSRGLVLLRKHSESRSCMRIRREWKVTDRLPLGQSVRGKGPSDLKEGLKHLVAPRTSLEQIFCLGSLGGFHESRAGHGDVVDVMYCPNCTDEVLF